MKILLIFLSLLMVSCSHNPKRSSSERASIFNTELNRIFKHCKNSIWENYDLTKHPILLVSKSEKSAHRVLHGSFSKIHYSDLPKSIQMFPSTFSFESYLDQEHLIMMLDQIPSKKNELPLVNLTIHEGFHLFYQSNKKAWLEVSSTSFRGTIFPVLAKPRYYRWMMFQSLNDYLKTNKKKYLGHFSWWFRKWKSEFPQEYSTPTDRGEGTAEYASLKSTSLNTQSCILKENSSYQTFKKYRKSWFEKEDFDLSSESYSVGALSGFALDKISNDWRETVSKKNISPIELLSNKFQSIEPKEKNINNLRDFEGLAEKEMTEIDKSKNLMKSLDQLTSKEFYKLFLPSKTWNMGGFAADGFYQILQPTPSINSMQVVSLSVPVKYTKKSQVVNITSKGHKLMRVRNAPCPDGKVGSVFLIEKKQVLPSGHIQTTFDGVDFNLNVKKSKKDSWLCG